MLTNSSYNIPGQGAQCPDGTPAASRCSTALPGQPLGLRPRAVHAQHADVGGLRRAAASRPAVLPSSSLVPVASSTSSAIWKARPMSSPYAVERRRPRPGPPRPRSPPSVHGGADQRAGLAPMHRDQLGQRELPALGLEVEPLAAHHPLDAAGREQLAAIAAQRWPAAELQLAPRPRRARGAATGTSRKPARGRGRDVELRDGWWGGRGGGRRRPCRGGRRAPASRCARSRPRPRRRRSPATRRRPRGRRRGASAGRTRLPGVASA